MSESELASLAENSPAMLWRGDVSWRCVYLNARMRAFWGLTEVECGAFDWSSSVIDDDREGVFGPFAAGMASQSPFECEGRYRRADGEVRVLRTRATPYTDKAGVFAGMIGVNEDITELRHAERGLEQALAQLQETTDHHRAIAARLSLATSISSLAMSEHDRDLRYTWAHNVSGDPIGKTPSEAFGETVGKPLEELLRRGLTEPQSEEFGLTVEGNALWLAIQTAPVYRAEGAAGVVASALDITHRKQNEQKLETLARELSHRVKNVFALVKAMVHQSARGRGVSHDFLATLDQRMTALASAQDALLSHDADKAILHELLESQVAHLSGVTSEGAHDITVPGRSAPYIALAVHELGTNATKYGSLSVPEGRVRLSWNRREDGFVTLVWHEEGGPRPESGRGKGFGTQLLTRVFAAATNGEATLTLTETGLFWQASFPTIAH